MHETWRYISNSHAILGLVDEQYRAIRQALGTRRKFFQDIQALLCYFQFATWEAVLTNGLELDIG